MMRSRRRNITRRLTFAGMLLAALGFSSAGAEDWNTPDPDYRHASPEAYERWHDLKYGLRIVWGYYSALGCEASWPMLQMPNEKKQEYFDLDKKFNPTEFDAEEWMDLLERCGLTYFTILTKHHDGFCMYDTKTRVKRRVNWLAPEGPKIEECDTDYDIMDAPFQRDVIKELCDAAHKRGIAIDLYFSHVDWYDADFRMDPYHPFHDKNFTSRAYDPEAYDRMIRRHREQIREILTNYGNIDMLCLDIRLPDFCWPDIKETVKMARRLQPDVLMRHRGIGAYGDYQTPENWIPASEGQTDKRVEKPWMVIYVLADQFAYERDGSKYKPGSWIVSSLIDIVAKGGNFMVSLGPDERGLFHPEAIQRLEYAGDWLKVNGQAIYKTRPWVKYKEGEDVRFTRSKDGKVLYAIALKWPGEEFALRTVRPAKGSRIRMLGVEKPLEWRADDDEGLLIRIPEGLQEERNRPCKQAYAFRIEGAEPSEIAPSPRVLLDGDPFGEEARVRLASAVEGASLRYTTDGSRPVAQSRVYGDPVVLKRGKTLRARTFKSGMSASDPVSFTAGVVNVNFQTRDYATPWNCVPDWGEAYADRGNGLTYGWNEDNTQTARNRENTLDTTFCCFLDGQTWEIAVPNGEYRVTVGLGDTYPSENTINVEGVNFCKDFRLEKGSTEFSRTVAVRDGKLTIDNGDAKRMMTKMTRLVITKQ